MSEKEKYHLQLKQEFEQDTVILGEQTDALIQCVAPYLTVSNNKVRFYLNPESTKLFEESMRFFRLCSCVTENVEDLGEYLQSKMEKLFTAIHGLNTSIFYGLISFNGQTNLVIGVDNKDAENIIKSILEGLLTGIELIPYKPQFTTRETHATTGGVISAVPILKVDDDKQKFDISTLMRSLNGQNYTVIFVSKPYPVEWVHDRYSLLLNIRDNCFSVSKRNVAKQESKNETDSITKTTSTTRKGLVQEALNQVRDKICSGEKFDGKSLVDSIIEGGVNSSSDTVNTTLINNTNSTTLSHEVQNGVALEIMEFCNKAIERFKQGQTAGLWSTAIAYSADNDLTANIVKSCLCGELAMPTTDIIPMSQIKFNLGKGEDILIPYMDVERNQLCVPITSGELAMICTPPFEAVPDFELKKGKVYPMVASSKDGVVIGKVSDGHRALPNMDFSLSEEDLNKHTFICGITGSGKTTTVKGILKNCNKPFMVIESAKKEYRNIKLDKDRCAVEVYTMGKPEINCLRFNPFYIQCGINLQTHIDFLKDLFNASFSFYGPMPYILEKCLSNVYRNKGWNLTLGYHRYLVNLENATDFFESDYMKKQYHTKATKFIFPTMQDLKNEVKRYIEEEMQYDGEVGGNIKTAILTRLESICIGSKGFMFNTNDTIDMEVLMQKNIVFELEGLSDDSDKAFCVGLLVVFINEYRQIYKEEHPREKLGLQHLLVIEEAHRLLKNIATERSSENMGNPKGKAVEHFTNMIAEMRSFGQGVVIAEQIPSKLAPDVIKNSSNKIVQRVVSADDQVLVANTIGISSEDAIYLGNLKTGVALCHKEGMSLPVFAFINNVEDDFVNDGDLFNYREIDIFEEINYSLVRENTSLLAENLGLKLLNSIMAQDAKTIAKAISTSKELMMNELIKKDVSLLMCRNKGIVIGKVLAENVILLLSNGVYSFGKNISNNLYETIEKLCIKGLPEYSNEVKELLKFGYMMDSKNKCVFIISELIKQNLTNTVNVKSSIQQYFVEVSDELVEQIEAKIKGVA